MENLLNYQVDLYEKINGINCWNNNGWYFYNYIPGVSGTNDLLNSLKTAEKENKGNKPGKYAAIDKINIEFFKPFIEEIKKSTKAAGIHCMAVEYERLFVPLLGDFPEYVK